MPHARQPTGPWQFGFRTHVIALMIASALPLATLGLYSITQLADAERALDRSQILSTTRAVSSSVDQFLLSAQKMLRALAGAFAGGGDLRDFYRDCAALARENDGEIMLADRTGRELFNTKRPLGARLPPVIGTPEFWQVVDTGEPRISNLFVSQLDGERSVSVLVPIVRSGRVTHVLAMMFPLQAIDTLLRSQHLPVDWTVGTVDRESHLLTGPTDFIGRKASPQVANMPMERDEGFFSIINLHGVPVNMGVERSPISGWKTVVGIPQSTVAAPLWRSIGRFALLGGLALLAVLAAVSLIGRRLSRDLDALARAATALGARVPLPIVISTVREVNQVAAALRRAGTERARREQELRRSQQHLALAQNVSRVGSVLHNHETGIDEWSDELYRVLGLEPGAAPPTLKTFLRHVHEDDRDLVVAGQASLVKGEGGLVPEYRIVRADGSVRVVHSEGQPLYDDAGRLVQILVTFHDVTDLRAAESRQRDLERQLQHAQKLEALGTLAGGIAHDLNNTLVPVLGLAKLTMRRLPEGSRERANVATIFKAGERARDLVQQVLAFSRKDAPTRERVDLMALTRDTLGMVRASLPATIHIDEEIEAAPLLLGDPGQLHQVLINLVVNAAQAIGDGMGTISVSLHAAHHSLLGEGHADATVPTAHLSVSDTGCGMDEATVSRVFEPFFTTKPVGEGTGLGLSVVHGIIMQHGGLIEVESRVGLGTRFDVYLPILVEENEKGRDLEPALLEE